MPNTELFALDIGLVIQLLSSFEGNQVYPKEKTKEEVFTQAAKEFEARADTALLPEGYYYLERSVRGFGQVKGKALVKDGLFLVLKGSLCAPLEGEVTPAIRQNAKISNHILTEDVICRSPSTAGLLVLGKSNNGWMEWKDEDGFPINQYRQEDQDSLR
ncbi:DUF4357 domain-containing protein [Peptococcus simiae]|uniref:DUF4357 domain-containing protein n=1 Tax=Peptococcus simiae TaxID=1643805 RepID=UPI00397F2A1B